MNKDFIVVPSVKDPRYVKDALKCSGDYLLLSGAHIGNLKQLSSICHQSGKKVLVNHELVGGLGGDKTAFKMLKKMYEVDGIMASSVTKINMIRNMDVEIIYRIPLIDSISVDSAIRLLGETRCDAIELRPYFHGIEFLPLFREKFQGKIFLAGFVNSLERLEEAKRVGFDGVMTSTRSLWN